MKTHRRRLFGSKHKNKPSGEMALQITSMADIFTILLVFLLKGLASDALAIAPSQGTKLPNGVHTTTLTSTALQIELSEKGILVEKEFVSDYKNFEEALNQRLSKEREKQAAIAQANDDVKNDQRVILLADQSVQFGTIKHILRNLSQNGYSDIKFGVIKE